MQETRNNCYILLDRKNVARPFVIRKQVSTCAVRCCYISALVLTCFHLTKGRATFFRSKTIFACFLHLIVLLFKVLLNHIFLLYKFCPQIRAFAWTLCIHRNMLLWRLPILFDLPKNLQILIDYMVHVFLHPNFMLDRERNYFNLYHKIKIILFTDFFRV